MPIYEYECPECNGINERYVSHYAIDEVADMCRLCGKFSSMKKMISRSTSFILKGGGWAKDGYSSKGE